MPEPSPEAIESFVTRWKASGGHERGAGQLFLTEFCELLDLPRPDPPEAENERNTHTFERRVDRTKSDGTTAPNWIDLYKAGHFVLETKQGVNKRRDKSDPDQPLLPDLDASTPAAGHGRRGTSAWDKALDRAHSQAERYIHALPADEGRPPFLIVCDVGHCFDLYAEFTGTGGQYEPFPDPRKRRVHLDDLRDPEIRERFRKIWTEPRSLDPSKHAAAVTREVAKALADLAKSLEKDGHDPQHTAGFLQRCLFTMFAEDVGLLPADSFLGILQTVKDRPAGLVTMLRSLWTDMANGSEFSVAIQEKIPHFNGGLFRETSVLPLRSDQIVYLIHAAQQDWSAVEPAIFGTLLERALDPRERHKLGAHYTPRSYVERLVRPTIIEPLRAEWESVKIAAAQLDDQGRPAKAREAVESFHHRLAKIRVLDPACGSGNFLYVSLALLKTLEAEVLDLFEKLGGNRSFETDQFSIRPTNFLGIEINPRAAAIAQLVLWIGYFQWHQRTTGRADTNDRPLLPRENTIECRDAVLAYDEKIPRTNPETGDPLTIWDGRTTKPHPVTGNEVPDESFRIPLYDYTHPKRPEWPEADFIVGNPPFIGNKRMRDALGSGYVDALREAWKTAKPDSWDFVMFWWQFAAGILRKGTCQRFGLITTNSITQSFNRNLIDPLLEDQSKPISLAFAIPNHPWVSSADGAAVRISMTVAERGRSHGVLAVVTSEMQTNEENPHIWLTKSIGSIDSALSLGARRSAVTKLEANNALANRGMTLVGKGFFLNSNSAGSVPTSERSALKEFVTGRDLAQIPKGRLVIDLFGLEEDEARSSFPHLYQHLSNHVKPDRLQNKRESYRNLWWMFAEPRTKYREALKGLKTHILSPRTASHRFFIRFPITTLGESEVITIALSDPYFQGILSSQAHVEWSLFMGSRLGVGDDPRYAIDCFETFPFPALEEGELKQRIRDLGEKLDAHRKARQAAHPELTLTGMYNVLEKLRTGETLTDKERRIHDDGLVTLLKQLHDDLDAAVLEAYGWSDISRSTGVPPVSPDDGHRRDACAPCAPLADLLARDDDSALALEQELLTRLVALNHERAEEEKRGLVRWLRPDYQAPEESGLPPEQQSEIELEAEEAKDSALLAPSSTLKWPATLPERVAAIHKLLPATGPDPSALAARFGRRSQARIKQIDEILETLRGLGRL